MYDSLYVICYIRDTQYDAILYYLPKTKNFDCVGEGRVDFPFLFKSCEIDRSQGRLVK